MLHIIGRNKISYLSKNHFSLAKIGDTEGADERDVFSISKAVTSVALPFESIAFESGISYQMDIEENLTYLGREAEIK